MAAGDVNDVFNQIRTKLLNNLYRIFSHQIFDIKDRMEIYKSNRYPLDFTLSKDLPLVDENIY